MGISSPTLVMESTPEEALAERVLREKARRRFGGYMRYMLPETMVPKIVRHHELLAFYLDQVCLYIESKGAEGIGRLMVFWPPRYWKTLMCSRLFPSYLFGRVPDTRAILTSYGGALAFKNSRNARDFVTSKKYAAIFGDKAARDMPPVELAKDERSVESWSLSSPYRGGVRAAGVGGGLTGEGGHLIVIDDPFKNREEAESERRRDEIWDWWTDSVYTRREDGAAIIIPQTRWHVDGLSGRLLKKMAEDPLADQWEVLCFPALWEAAEVPEDKSFDEYHRDRLREGVWVDEQDPLERKPGEALWPDKHDAQELAMIRANMGPYGFESLYQQLPYLRSGEFFKRNWFTIVDNPPKPDDILARIRYWDKAASKGGDFSVGVLMCVTKDKFYYVEHVVRGRWTPGKRDEVIVDTAKMDLKRKGPRMITWHQQDPGSAGRDSAEATNRKLAEVGMRARFEPVSGNKEVRADPYSSMCQAGFVRLVRGAWNDPFIEIHVAFPKGKYDDDVDAASSAFNELAKPVVESEIF